MTTGSPALAAYSLVLTALNVRSVSGRAKATNCEDWEDVAKFLISTQQIPLELIEVEYPLEIAKGKRSLELIKYEYPPKLTKYDYIRGFISDKNWRGDITKLVNQRSNDWTLATALSVAWVIIAFLVTLADSLAYLAVMGSQGHAVGTLWLWLLCLVIGWLWLPTFSGNQLQSAFRESAKKAIERLRKTNKRLRKANEKEQSTQERTETHVEETPREAKPPLRPSYRQSTVSTACATQSQDVLRSIRLMVVTKQKVTSLNRDEHRFSATFNYSRVMRYLAFVDGVLEALDMSQWEDEVGLSSKRLAAVVSLMLNRRGS